MTGRNGGARALSIVTAALAAVTLTLAATQAQEAANRRVANVGTVDLSRLFRKYPLTRQLARELREWKIEQDAAIEAKKKELSSARDTLVGSDGGAAKDAHSVLVSANRELTQLREKATTEYESRLLGNDRQVYAKIRAAIERVRAAEQLDLVLQALDDDISAKTIEQQAINIRVRTLLGAAPRFDITDLVLDALREEGSK